MTDPFVVCGIDGCDFAVERGEGRTMALHQSEDHEPTSRAVDTPTPPEAVAWLIERGQPEGLDRAEWYEIASYQGSWTQDAFAAQRFTSADEAAEFIRHDHLTGRPVLHGFVGNHDFAASGDLATPDPSIPERPAEPPKDRCRHTHTRAEHPDCFDQSPDDWYEESARRRRARGGQ